MTTTHALPFKASKPFVMLGVQVQPGDVIDIAPAGLARVKQMEDLGFGLRVAKDAPLTSKPKKAPATRTRKRAPAAVKSTAAKKTAKKTSARKRAGKG